MKTKQEQIEAMMLEIPQTIVAYNGDPKGQLLQETAAGLAMATAFTDGDFKGMSIILNTEGGQAEVRLDVTSDGEARVFVYKVGEDEPSDTIVLN